MDVGSAAESFDHMFIFAQMRHDAEFDLRIVGGEEDAVFIVGDECLADLTSQVVTDRDVLQVGVRRTQTAGRSHGLVEGSVHFTCPGPDQFGQGIDVCAQQLLQSAVLQ